MGHEDLGVRTRFAPDQQDVDVERARPPVNLASASTLRLGALRAFEEFSGRRVRGQLEDQVPEIVLSDTTDRFGFVDERQSVLVRARDGGDAQSEVFGAIRDVRAER
jgi:hypothetical protein